MNYEQACSEMNFILNNLKADDLEKIPKKFIQFFANNMDKEYQVKIDLNKPLYEQSLLEETKAFIKIIQIKYFTPEEKRREKINELGFNNVDNNFNYDSLFKNRTSANNSSNEKVIKNSIVSNISNENSNTSYNSIENSNTSLVKYESENKLINFIKNIIRKFFMKSN